MTVGHYGERIYAFVVLSFSFITYVETFNLGTFLSNRTQIPMRGENASVYTVATIKKLFLFILLLLFIWVTFYTFLSDEFIQFISTETDPKILKIGKNLINMAVLYGLIKIPLSVVLSAFAGHDRVDIEKKYNGLQQLIKFFALLVTINLGLSVEIYFMTFTLIGILLLVYANIHYYKVHIAKKAKKYFRYSKKISSSYITKKSMKFYIMALASVVVWSTDNLVVSIFFTPKLVTDYSINFAIYNAGFLFITAIGGALIANYGNLIRDKQFVVLNQRINLSIYSTFIIAGCISFGGVLFAEDIIRFWVGSGHHISSKLLIAFGLFGMTIGISSVMNTILSLFARTKTLVLMAISEALLNILLSIGLLHLVGVEGIAYATGISAFITMVLPGIYLLNKAFNQQLKIRLRAIFIQLLLFSIFTFFSYESLSSFWLKVVVFLFYAFCIVISTFFTNRKVLLTYFELLKR